MAWLVQTALPCSLAVALVSACTGNVAERVAAGSGGGGPQADAGPDAGSGGSPTDPSIDAGLLPVATLLGIPGNLILDGKSLVTTSYDYGAHTTTLIRVSLDTWAVTTVLASSPTLSLGDGLTADADRFYFWASAPAPDGPGIYAYPRAGGAPARITGVGTLEVKAGAYVVGSSIAVDATRVYWIEQGAGYPADPSTVMAAPLSGGPGVTLYSLAPPEVMAGSLAVDATSIYFTTLDPSNLYASAAYALPLAGGPPAPIWQGGDALHGAPSSILTDGKYAYVLDPGGYGTDCPSEQGQLVRIYAPADVVATIADGLRGAGPAATVAGSAAFVGSSFGCNGAIPAGAITRIASTGLQKATLATGTWSPISIVVGGADVYWGAALYDLADAGPGGLGGSLPTGYGILHLTQ